MIVYKFDAETGEYMNPFRCQPNPARPGEFLQPPANTTPEKPPKTGKHEWPVRRNGAWIVVPDYRGYEYWLADGSHHKIEELDIVPPADALDEPPPPPVPTPEGAAQAKLQTINGMADAILQPITSMYPATEVVSWDKQEVEARRWQEWQEWQEWQDSDKTEPEPPTALIDQILVTRTDVDKPELVRRIIAKADAYATSGQIFGIRHTLEKDIETILANDALTDDQKRAAILAIDPKQAFSVVSF